MSTKEEWVEIEGLSIKIVKKPIKCLRLAVCPPDGWVKVSVPEFIDYENVRLAVKLRLDWIKRQQKLLANQVKPVTYQFVSGESHYFLGRRYLLEIVSGDRKPHVFLKNRKKLVLSVSESATLAERSQLLYDWYRSEFKCLLPDMIKNWENKSGLKVDSYGIRRMKTRWGSCSPAHRRISLNLELIKKPINCIEYVLVHEMVHFLERHHNKNFSAHMDRLMPQWRQYADELNHFSQRAVANND